MLPLTLLPQLSPAAAKLYLVLRSLHPSTPKASLPTLASLAALSPSTCKRALRQLQNLHLLKRLPRHYHAPNTFTLLTPLSDFPTSPLSPTNSSPMTPNPQTKSSPMSPLSYPTPPIASKTQNGSPMTPLLNTHCHPSTLAAMDAAEAELAELDKLEAFFNKLKKAMNAPRPS